MEQIGIVMILAGFTGALIIIGKWIYKTQGKEITTLYAVEVMILIGTFLATGGNR